MYSFTLNASVKSAESLYQRGNDPSRYNQIARELVESKLYFSALALIKSYLHTRVGPVDLNADETINAIAQAIGVRQFEILSEDMLLKSRSPYIKYVLGKKYFREGKFDSAIRTLESGIPEDHQIRPFALMVRGNIFSINRKHMEAVLTYNECIKSSNRAIGNAASAEEKFQLEVNRDYCIIGIPRSEFAVNKYDLANSHYMDLPKESPVWPEILFEEAWTSFYLRDYNRTLGKLVTYKAPLFEHIFNPEIDILTALTYMELCLWEDSSKVVEGFYSEYQDSARNLNALVNNIGNNNRDYYLLAKSRHDGIIQRDPLLNRILTSTVRDPSYLEQYNTFMKGQSEVDLVNQLPRSSFKELLISNLKDSLMLQRDLIGSYVRKNLVRYIKEIEKSLENMSYVKLEILDRKKTEIMDMNYDGTRKRGDIQYLKRNDKQYFWTFNGEFWADELGDYVFALRSECRK